MRTIVLLLILLGTSNSVFAQETRYIRDVLYVPLRSGQTTQHRIVHKGLVSGTPVTLITLNEDETYSHVRTQGGIEGWIQTQYLSDEPAARDQLATAEQRIEQLQQSNSNLNQQLSSLKQEEQQAKNQLAQITTESNALNNELTSIKEISANAIQLNSDNQRLLEENQMLKNEVDVLSTDNQRLIDEKNNEDFLNGAFAVLIGVFITLIVPRLWPKKSTDWA